MTNPINQYLVNPDSNVKIKLTKLSAETFNTNSNASKTYFMSGSEIKSKHPDQDAGHHLEIIETTLPMLPDLIRNMTPDESFVFGLPNERNASAVAPRSELELAKETFPDDVIITRTKEAWHFAEDTPGLLFLDFDDLDRDVSDPSNEDIDAVMNKVFDAIPAMKDADYVINPSSSSFLINPKTGESSGGKGYHVFFAVDDAGFIPDMGKILFDRLVLNGHGFIKVSASGAALERSIIDASVWQASRLCFEGGAMLRDGIAYSDERQPKFIQGKNRMLTLTDFSALSGKETKDLSDIWANEKANARPKIERAQRKVIAAIADQDEREARQVAFDSMNDGKSVEIAQGFKIIIERSNEKIDVKQIMDDVIDDLDKAIEKWHQTQILDPISGEAGKTMLYVNDDGSIRIHSFDGGGRKYNVPLTKKIALGTTVETARRIEKALSNNPRFYRVDKKGSLAFVPSKGNVRYYTSDEKPVREFAMDVEGVFIDCQDIKTDKEGNTTFQKKGIPPSAIKYFLDSDAGSFDILKRVSTIPAIDNDLNVYGLESGYHTDSKILFKHDGISFPKIKSDDEANEVIDYLIAPFSEFLMEMDDKMKRSLMLACVMTMVFRSMLELAPGLFINVADHQGQSSGKTTMARALAYAGGWRYHTREWKGNRESMKAAIAHLRDDSDAVLYFDNAEGTIASGGMAMIMTSSVYSDRVLGETRNATVPTNLPIMISGNAVDLSPDLAERFLNIELQKQEQNPGWLPWDKIDQQKFKESCFALIDYVRREKDVQTITASLRNKKFHHWAFVVQAPVIALTGVDPMEHSRRKSDEAKDSENYTRLAIMNQIWDNLNADQKRRFSFKDISGRVDDDHWVSLVAEYGYRTDTLANRSKAFQKMARVRFNTSGGKIDRFVLETVATRKDDGVPHAFYRISREDLPKGRRPDFGDGTSNVVALHVETKPDEDDPFLAAFKDI